MIRGLLGAAFLAVLLAAFPVGSWPETSRDDPSVKSVHLFDLPDGLSEDDLIAGLRILNRAIESTGHTEVGYVLWRVSEAQVGESGSIDKEYIMEGIWSSQAVYDEIHETEAWLEAREATMPVVAALGEVQLYSRYEQLSVGGPGER